MRLDTIRAKILFYTFGFLIPVLLLLAGSIFYSAVTLERTVRMGNENMLNLYAKQIDSIFSRTEAYLVELANNSRDFSCLKAGRDIEEKKLACFWLQADFSDMLFGRLQDMEGYFVYDQKDDLWAYAGIEMENDYRKRKENFLDSGNGKNGWRMVETGEQYFLVRSYTDGAIHYGAWAGAQFLLKDIKEVGIRGISAIAILGEKTQIYAEGEISPADFAKEQDIWKDNSRIRIKGKSYVTVNRRFGGGNLQLVVFLDEKELFFSAGLLVYTGIFVFLAAVVFLLILYIFSLRDIVRPAEEMQEAMEEAGSGRLTVRLPEAYRVRELRVLGRGFNRMMADINHLIVHNYEMQLKHQKAVMNYLQLQIAPHFMMNGLNIVYNYARIGDVEQVKELTMVLVRHYRYTLYGKPLVAVGQELDFVKNYMRMQEMKDGGKRLIRLRVKMEEELAGERIPILAIQTFVENSVKNILAVRDEGLIEITAKTMEWKGKHGIFIQVTDDGPGFSSDILKHLNQNEPIVIQKEERIGIANVQLRASMLYEQEFFLRFRNGECKGAIAEAWYPQKYREDETHGSFDYGR